MISGYGLTKKRSKSGQKVLYPGMNCARVRIIRQKNKKSGTLKLRNSGSRTFCHRLQKVDIGLRVKRRKDRCSSTGATTFYFWLNFKTQAPYLCFLNGTDARARTGGGQERPEADARARTGRAQEPPRNRQEPNSPQGVASVGN